MFNIMLDKNVRNRNTFFFFLRDLEQNSLKYPEGINIDKLELSFILGK